MMAEFSFIQRSTIPLRMINIYSSYLIVYSDIIIGAIRQHFTQNFHYPKEPDILRLSCSLLTQ